MSRLLFLNLFFAGFFLSFIAVSTAFAVDCTKTPGFVEKAGVCFPNATGLGNMSVFDFLQVLMNWLLGIIGVLAVIAFVISGIQYLTSAGDEKMAETAKRNMTYAIIGLVVALAGLIIVNAVAGLTGADGAVYY
ncbi:MAG: hypothetical protein AUK19_01075 [Candidatus Moranbacteria bacterium CG2_30_45_14]|nr:MAG: hypothetical protein AUK19_01075 [Candidatus Moranbacteria bacterium CG2_30_45_14]